MRELRELRCRIRITKKIREIGDRLVSTPDETGQFIWPRPPTESPLKTLNRDKFAWSTIKPNEAASIPCRMAPARELASRNYAALRLDVLRRLFAADFACRESAAWLAVFFGSRFRASRRALLRLPEVFFALGLEDRPFS